MRIIIPDFPLSPTSNKLTGSFFDKKAQYVSKKTGQVVTGKMRHYSTGVHDAYKTACHVWALEQHKSLKEVRSMLRERTRQPEWALNVSTYFIFRHSNFWSSMGLLLQVDASNRIKACHDELAKALGIDDRYFNIDKAERVWVHDHEAERCIVVLTDGKFRNASEVERDLGLSDVPEEPENRG